MQADAQHTQDPIKKSQLELIEATNDFGRYLELVASGAIAAEVEITATNVYRRLKDAMNRIEFMTRSAAMDEAGQIKTAVTA